MSEPKKETVRIVLPPRREGQPLASTPRETAMINLPPKPVAVPAPPATAAPVMPPPAAPKLPTNLQPPAAPGAPSLPGAPKPPGLLKPPGAPLAPPAPPMAPVAPAAAPVAPALAPKPVTVGPIPVAVKPQPKKETAKVVPAAAGLLPKPQATVRLQPRPAPTQATAASFNVQTLDSATTADNSEEEIPMNIAIAAVVTAVIALAIQLWMMVA